MELVGDISGLFPRMHCSLLAVKRVHEVPKIETVLKSCKFGFSAAPVRMADPHCGWSSSALTLVSLFNFCELVECGWQCGWLTRTAGGFCFSEGPENRLSIGCGWAHPHCGWKFIRTRLGLFPAQRLDVGNAAKYSVRLL